jgi:hypothetical protein
LWDDLGVKKVIANFLQERKFEFDVERAVFLTVLHRLLASGSDRSCDAWRDDHVVKGAEALKLASFISSHGLSQRGAYGSEG